VWHQISVKRPVTINGVWPPQLNSDCYSFWLLPVCVCVCACVSCLARLITPRSPLAVPRLLNNNDCNYVTITQRGINIVATAGLLVLLTGNGRSAFSTNCMVCKLLTDFRLFHTNSGARWRTHALPLCMHVCIYNESVPLMPEIKAVT